MPEPQPLVLIIDNDAVMRNSFTFMLSVEGFAVRAHERPDDLLTDPDLPIAHCIVVNARRRDIDSLELPRLIRETNATAPAILLTGRSSDVLRARAEANGFLRVLELPLMDNTLVEIIRAVVDRRRPAVRARRRAT